MGHNHSQVISEKFTEKLMRKRKSTKPSKLFANSRTAESDVLKSHKSSKMILFNNIKMISYMDIRIMKNYSVHKH